MNELLECFMDGDMVCVKQYGFNIQEGFCGFGYTLREALLDFCDNSGY